MERPELDSVDLVRAFNDGRLKGIRCPICGGIDLEARSECSDNSVQDTHVAQGRISGLREDVDQWMVPITCSTCGYVMMFDSVKLAKLVSNE